MTAEQAPEDTTEEPVLCWHCDQPIRKRRRDPDTWEHAKTRAEWCYNSTVATPPPTPVGPMTGSPEIPVGVIVQWYPGKPIAEGWAFLDGTVRLEDHPALAEALATAYPENPWTELPVIPGHAIRTTP